MTELYIDRQLIVLPETFSITIIEENPFFTKNGSYTYDISLSLLDPINAKIYKHLNRLNRKGDIPKNRSAYLVVDNEVVLNGTEVILEHTDKEVKIQLVSGNSELNFLIGGDKKIRDLDLGEAEAYTGTFGVNYQQVYIDLQKSYPEREWQLLPYYTNEYDIQEEKRGNSSLHVGNNYSLLTGGGSPPWNDRYYAAYNSLFSGQIPQPYLCAIIKKIVESLGYTLEYNAIAEHHVYKNLYIVNGFLTRKFAEMLPNWTAKEFFNEIEQWLDCLFLVDGFTKKVKLLFNYQADEINTNVELHILDEYIVSNDSDGYKAASSANCSYSLDDDTYYKYMNLDTRYRERANRIEVGGTLNSFITGVKNNIYKDKGAIYEVDGAEYIIYESGKSIKKVDSFKPIFNDKDKKEIDIEFNIIPAAMTPAFLRALTGNMSNPYGAAYWVQVPIASDYDPLSSEAYPQVVVDDDLDLQKLLDGEEQMRNEANFDKMRLAIYGGLKRIEAKNEEPLPAYYPIVYVESLAEYITDSGHEHYFDEKDNNPFRLEFLKKEIYDKALPIDTSKIYKLQSIDHSKSDIKSLFVANGKSFRCIKRERTISDNGFSEITKGEFYSYI